MTGCVPFYQYPATAAIQKVVTGARPERPEFTVSGLSDDLWQIVELCWHQQWNERISIRLLLERLNEATPRWVPPSPTMAPSMEIEENSDVSSTISGVSFYDACGLSVHINHLN